MSSSTPGWWILWAAAAAAAASGVYACSSTPKLQGPGGSCLRVDDCEKGLVCVEHRCSSDLSPIVGTEGAPAREGGTGDDAAAE
jgi:hypothetical protein